MTQGRVKGLVSMWQSQSVESKDTKATISGMADCGISSGQGGKDRQEEQCEQEGLWL